MLASLSKADHRPLYASQKGHQSGLSYCSRCAKVAATRAPNKRRNLHGRLPPRTSRRRL
jgi:hypothetical protein